MSLRGVNTILLVVGLVAMSVLNVVAVQNGLCPIHHGIPVKDEVSAIGACHASNFCHPVNKCIPCKLEAEYPCAKKEDGDCGYSFSCMVNVVGQFPGLVSQKPAGTVGL
jgi:hypothetical protein